MARSSVYASRGATVVAFPVRRGPKTLYSDARLTEEIRAALAASPTAELVGVHAAKRATRYETLEPLRQGIRPC